jgi:hypothetical protein
MPITMGIMPINPIIYVGTTSAIKEPRALMTISNPNPIYRPIITWRTGNVNGTAQMTL